MPKLRLLIIMALAASLCLPFSGCIPSVGRPFPVKMVRQIEIGETSRVEVRQMFGDPWRTGIEDGFKTWTYGEYSVNNSRDLVIRFDENGVVTSYSFSSSYPQDENL